MLLEYVLFFLYALLPFQMALNPIPGVDLALVRIFVPLVTFWWLVKSLQQRKLSLPTSPVAWLLLSFLFTALFSLFFAQNLAWGLRKLLFLLSLAPIYFILADVLKDSRNRNRLLFALVLGAFAVASLGVLQFAAQFLFGLEAVQTFWATHVIKIFLGDTFAQAVLKYPSWLVNIGGKNYLRAFATFPDPHMLAFFLNLSLPFAFLGFWTNRNWRWFFALAAAVILLCSLLTFSRGGYLGLLSIFLVGSFFYFKNNLLRNTKRWGFLLLFLLLLGILINNPIKTRFLATFDQTDGSNQGRLALWQQTITIIERQPWGVGLGNYALEILPSAAYRDPIYAHNIYLDIAAELGLWGLFFWLSLLLTSAWFFWQNASTKPFALAALLSITALMSHGLFESPLFSVHIFLLIILILALASQQFHETRA